MIKAVSSIIAAALMLASNAFAQGYVGAALGPTHLNDDCAGTTSCDLGGFGMKLFGGYRLNPTWAAEVNYFDFGKAEATGNVSGATVSAAIKGTAFGIGLVGSAPAAANWTGLFRFGVAQVKAEVSGSVGSQSVPSDSDTSTQAYIGVGLSYAITKNLSIDGAGDWSKARWGDSSADVRLISIGLTYGF